MQKISPLRSSIEAFNKFRAERKAAKTEQTQESKSQTNPFGITFKGTVIQMDVFEKSDKTGDSTVSGNSFKEKMENTGKLLASAWVGTINKFSSLKTNVISFGNKIKEGTITAAKKVYDFANAPIELNVFKYNVSNLQNKSVDELRTMLTNELQGVTNE